MPDTDLTELIEIDPSRVDGVRRPASGLPILLMKAVSASGAVNEKPDIAGAETILSKLAQLIIAEAQEMAAGEFSEVCDIDLLAQAAHLMLCFRSGEQMNAEMSKAELRSEVAKQAEELGVTIQFPVTKESDMPETPATPEDTQTPPAETPEVTPDAPVEKSLGDLVKEEVAKAVQPLEERNQALEAEMALLKSTPIPGGPMVTAPGGQVNESAKATNLAQAQHFDNLAKDISGNPELTRYYQERAAEARQAAKA